MFIQIIHCHGISQHLIEIPTFINYNNISKIGIIKIITYDGL